MLTPRVAHLLQFFGRGLFLHAPVILQLIHTPQSTHSFILVGSASNDIPQLASWASFSYFSHVKQLLISIVGSAQKSRACLSSCSSIMWRSLTRESESSKHSRMLPLASGISALPPDRQFRSQTMVTRHFLNGPPGVLGSTIIGLALARTKSSHEH